jgi:hypothetical protein
MKLRICDGGRERIIPASLEVVEQAFAPEARIADSTEIAVADGARWLAALVVQMPGEPETFLLSGELGPAGAVSDRVDRAGALQRFRDFVSASWGC